MKNSRKDFFTEQRKLLYSRLNNLAEQKSLSLFQVEKINQLSQNTLSKCDEKSTQWESLYEAAEFFNVSLDYLVGRTNNPFVKEQEVSTAILALIEFIRSENLSDEMILFLIEILKCILQNKDKIM